MESPQGQDTIEDEPIIASPQEEESEAPRDELQERFDKQIRNEEAQGIVAPLITPQDQEIINEDIEENSGATAESSRVRTTTETGGRGRGRGSRVASSGSSRGRGAGKGSARGGRGGASTSGTRGGKQTKISTTKSGRGGGAKLKPKEATAAASTIGTEEGSSNNIAGLASATTSNSSSGGGAFNTIFPLARVSRIVKVDKEIEMTSKDAIWTIAIATELFIKHLTDSAYTKAKLDKKKTKTITFKELSFAVESKNEFWFLEDIIPKTISFSKALEFRQEIEEKNHMREIGIFSDSDDDEEEEEEEGERERGTSTLINQTLGDDAEDSQVGEEQIDEQGDIAMNDKQPSAALLNGSAEEEDLSNGRASPESESEMIM